MIRTKLLMAVFIGTLVYTAVSSIAGRNGILCYNQLNMQKKEIVRRTEIIQNVNNELMLEYKALLKDKDVIAAYARKLDYVGTGEKLVKIKGLKPMQTTLYDTGSILRGKPSEFVSEKICKIMGTAFFCLTFLLMILIDLSIGKLSFERHKNDVIQRIPMYDLSKV